MFFNRKISNLEKAIAQHNSEGIRLAVKPVIPFLGHPDYKTLWCAINVLVKSGEPAVEPLIASLRARSSKLRRFAALTLGKLGNARAVETLIATLKDQDKWVRGSAAKAPGQLEDARATGTVDR